MKIPEVPDKVRSNHPNDRSPLSPKQFLKMRRPERFSDTVSSVEPSLDRAMLEYHLDTLTNRSEELRFEEFAKALLQRTVCPNLLPHTGPSGGGDSKVDSETYPVAQSLALSWYVGEPEKASTERWAFAFSAKEEWRPKVQSDVGKIIGTQRGYSKIFFVSNQFIRDKVRAEVEDALQEKHGVNVRIFDRTWILDRIYDNKLESIAIDLLHIKTELRRQERKGPRDADRQQEFERVEAEIAAAIQGGRQSIALVDNGLLSADLARGMERPRQEVDGLFARAKRLANEYGTAHQQFLCDYEHAWTTYWWYEDYTSFVQQYNEVERRARESQNPYELELWSNLFTCLHVIAHLPDSAIQIDLEQRAKFLLDSLATVAQQDGRPSAALHAQSLSLEVQLLTAEPGRRNDLLGRLANVVQKAEGLIGYPFEPLMKIVIEYGAVFGEFHEYQRLFEEVVAVSTQRAGEVTAARLLLRRGAQLLDSGQVNDAIRMLGRVMGKLYKHESRKDAVHALYLCSHAYEQMGLFWAARGTALAAASIATNDYLTYETLTPQQWACYNQIKWMELRLGRLGPMLAWHELDYGMRMALMDHGFTNKSVTQDDMFDPVTGILLLNADLETLRDLTRLPEVLDSSGLPMSAVALLYALGHEDKVPSALVGEHADEKDRHNFFKTWRDQPAKSDLPPAPKLDLTQNIRLGSSIAGCKIDVTCRNESPFVELGESLLACIEALLATAIIDGIVAREPLVIVKISIGEFVEPPFTFDAEDVDGRPTVRIRCRPFSPHKLTMEEQTTLKDRLFEVVAHVLGRAFLLQHPETLLTKLFRDDLAPQRALDFTMSFVVVGNILGDDTKSSLDRWIDPKTKEYPLLRKEVWDKVDREASSAEQHTNGLTLHPGTSGTPPEVHNLDQVSHRQIQTVSLIREAIWDEAGWHGVVYATAPDPSAPPILALLFDNTEAGMKILKGWRGELGDADEGDKLRIAILRHIRRDTPYWYRIVIGTNPTLDLVADSVKQIVMVSRIHTMTPDSPQNLERFLASYKKRGEYILCQAKLNKGKINLDATNEIRKKQIVVRDAWEVGPHDLEVVGIKLDDDPIIPQGIQDPPITKTLERKMHGR